jgi:taurine--2-oxoglutarate transaminase
MQLTGDPRRWPNEPGTPGIIRVMDPRPYNYSFGDHRRGATEEHLRYLEEVIMYEGPQTIAAMIVETVTGTNGVLPPPEGYLPKRRLLEKYGILLICDEVMAASAAPGRCSRSSTTASSPTSSQWPKASPPPTCRSARWPRDPIAEFFRTNVFWGGLTYNAHPLCLAVAHAAIEVMQRGHDRERREVPTGDARRDGPLRKPSHPSFKEPRPRPLRHHGAAQKDSKGTPIAPYNGALHLRALEQLYVQPPALHH